MERAKELDFLEWFYMNADFGPAHSEIMDYMCEDFMDETRLLIPKGYNYFSDGETSTDTYLENE